MSEIANDRLKSTGQCRIVPSAEGGGELLTQKKKREREGGTDKDIKKYKGNKWKSRKRKK